MQSIISNFSEDYQNLGNNNKCAKKHTRKQCKSFFEKSLAHILTEVKNY